jgi:hypothetical protein
VGVSAFRHPEAIRVALLNAPPAVVSGATLWLRPPEGTRFVALEELPSGRQLRFETDAQGTLAHTVDQVPELTMMLARYEAA